MQKQVFSETVARKLGNYVYRLIDPRNGTTFYVGHGQGNRVSSHAAGRQRATDFEDEDALKLKTIRAIRNAGFEVQHVIHRHGMNEETAKEGEAALIDAYPGLTNVLDFAFDCGYLSAESHEELAPEYERVGRMLSSMISTPEKFAPRQKAEEGKQ